MNKSINGMHQSTYSHQYLLRIIAMTLVGSLAGCASFDNGDLDQRLNEIKARPADKIPPLPIFKPYTTYLYSAAEAQDPFQLVETMTMSEERVAAKPMMIDRKREALEEYPLDTLRYVGQLIADGREWAIVTTPDMIVHRVRVGNYMGQNYGKITAIEEGKIVLTETVPDEYSGWIERDAALSLTEQ